MSAETHARQAWKATRTVPGWFAEQQRKRKREQSLGTRAGVGCLGFLIFGFIWVLVPLLVIATVEAVVVAYALIVSIAWGASAAVARVRRAK